LAQLTAVLFDFGDTLFYSPDGAGLMVEEGLAPDLADRLWREIWASARSAAELARQRDVSPERHREAWTRLFARAEPHLPGVSERLYERVMVTDNWTPFPDSERTLPWLKERGVRVGVVSNVTSDLRPAFARHGLDAFVDSFTHSFEQRVEKPDPRIFLAACEALGSRPAETLMVGDSHLADGGAVEAGLTTLLLPPVSRGTERGLDLVTKLF
jgi:putative hydrolase of the HAD superfamily